MLIVLPITFRAHQTHYEQMGQVVGTVTIAGKEYPFNIDSMRDHSYGKICNIRLKQKQTENKIQHEITSRSQARMETASSVRISYNDLRRRNSIEHWHCQSTVYFVCVRAFLLLVLFTNRHAMV